MKSEVAHSQLQDIKFNLIKDFQIIWAPNIIIPWSTELVNYCRMTF